MRPWIRIVVPFGCRFGDKGYSRGLRAVLQAELAGQPDVIFTTSTKDCNRLCYREEMRAATFCLCPRGWSPWTLRAYQVNKLFNFLSSASI